MASPRATVALQPTVRAFEVKLSDWRRGLMQAHRYSFFSDAAILVIPDSKLPLAKKSLPTFRSLNVGLWGYNEISKAITKVLTPRPKRPAPNGHRAKAIDGHFVQLRKACHLHQLECLSLIGFLKNRINNELT